VIDSKLLLKAPVLRDHPVDVGLRTEAAILSHLVRTGYAVLLPFGVNQRYDLVIDIGGEFVRAQCKTGRYRDGAITFRAQSVITSKTRNVTRGYHGEADVFLVHCPDFAPIFCVPVDEAPGTRMHLRVETARNGQSDRVHWASEYALPG
jgi:PD-(D/E)XK endonuclease